MLPNDDNFSPSIRAGKKRPPPGERPGRHPGGGRDHTREVASPIMDQRTTAIYPPFQVVRGRAR